jgi:uncharacterized protein (DUF1499 family)
MSTLQANGMRLRSDAAADLEYLILGAVQVKAHEGVMKVEALLPGEITTESQKSRIRWRCPSLMMLFTNICSFNIDDFLNINLHSHIQRSG